MCDVVPRTGKLVSTTVDVILTMGDVVATTAEVVPTMGIFGILIRKIRWLVKNSGSGQGPI